MLVSDLQRHVANLLPPETRMTGFLGAVRLIMTLIRAHGDRLGGWSFYWTRAQLDMIPEYTTGTVAISNGATTVTGTDTVFTDAMVGRKILIGGIAYVINSRASNTEIELATVYGGTDETVATFTVYQDEYALDANISRVHRIWDKENKITVKAISPLAMGDRDFLADNSGNIEVYAEVGRNSSNQRLVQFHPFPTTIARLEYWYQADITQVSSVGSTVDIPDYFDELVKQGTYARMLEILDASPRNVQRQSNLFDLMLAQAMEYDSAIRDEIIRMLRSDDIEPFRFVIREARNVTVT